MYLLASDSYFHTGLIHQNSGRPGQDYALAEANDQWALALVSDGCSSGRRTDIGARLLVLASRLALSAQGASLDFENLPVAIRSQQAESLALGRTHFGLTNEDLLATLLLSYVTRQGAYLYIWGDGVYALKRRDGSIRATAFEWADNMPYYPAYEAGDLPAFIVAHGADLSAPRVTERRIEITAAGELSGEEISQHSLAAGIAGFSLFLGEAELKELEYIALFSDGISQVDKLALGETIMAYLAFKNNKGAFVKRRMIKAGKDFRKIGQGPLDDISLAVIRLEKIEEEEENENES